MQTDILPVCFIFIFEPTDSDGLKFDSWLAENALEISIFLPQLPNCWDSEGLALHLTFSVTGEG